MVNKKIVLQAGNVGMEISENAREDLAALMLMSRLKKASADAGAGVKVILKGQCSPELFARLERARRKSDDSKIAAVIGNYNGSTYLVCDAKSAVFLMSSYPKTFVKISPNELPEITGCRQGEEP